MKSESIFQPKHEEVAHEGDDVDEEDGLHVNRVLQSQVNQTNSFVQRTEGVARHLDPLDQGVVLDPAPAYGRHQSVEQDPFVIAAKVFVPNDAVSTRDDDESRYEVGHHDSDLDGTVFEGG